MVHGQLEATAPAIRRPIHATTIRTPRLPAPPRASPGEPGRCSFPHLMLALLLGLAHPGDAAPTPKDSLPAAASWQQQVAYVVTAALDEPSGVLTGYVHISYVN